MNIRVTSRSAMFIALMLISILGVILVLQATPEGAGLSDDSIAYIAGARSMVAGHGYREAWLASNRSRISHRHFQVFWHSLDYSALTR
jgi:hypothetical protein